MAKCEQGYLCKICGLEVEGIAESELYLRYVIGWLDPEVLHTSQERHLRCVPALAQFIVHPDFPPQIVAGEFDKRLLDPVFLREREELVTRGWSRLREIESLLQTSEMSVHEYPLPEVRLSMTRRFGGNA